MNKFTTHKLTNGLEYILVPDDSFNNICFVFYVRLGSKYEIERVNGIAHFIEHMVFKGTTKYPKPIDIADPSFGAIIWYLVELLSKFVKFFKTLSGTPAKKLV